MDTTIYDDICVTEEAHDILDTLGMGAPENGEKITEAFNRFVEEVASIEDGPSPASTMTLTTAMCMSTLETYTPSPDAAIATVATSFLIAGENMRGEYGRHFTAVGNLLTDILTQHRKEVEATRH